MKNGIIAAIILFLAGSCQLCAPSFSAIYDFTDKDFEGSFQGYCENCEKDVNLEEEIKKFLEEEQCPVSLDEVLAVALENNFDIKSKYETYQSYRYLYRHSLAKFLPDFNYQFYSIYYNGQVLVGTAFVDRFNELALSSVISVRHSLTEGGRQIFEAKTAKFKKFENKEYYKYTKEEVLMMTATRYWQLLQAKLDIEIYLKNLYERIAQLKLTENLESAGLGTKFDVIRQKNEVASAKRSLVEAMNTFRLCQARLSNVMGIEINTSLYPIENEVKPLNLVNKDISLDELYKTAEIHRKDVKALNDEIKAMRNEKRAIYSEFVPKPRIFYQNQNQGTAKIGLGQGNVLGLYVDFDLGDGLGVGVVQRAKAKAHDIEAKIYDLTNRLRKIKEDLLKSYYNSKLLLKRIDITSEQVNYATESVKLAEMRLDAGQGILIDVIQAQSQKTIARIEYLQAVIDYNINQVELLFYEGIIDIEKIINDYNP